MKTVVTEKEPKGPGGCFRGVSMPGTSRPFARPMKCTAQWVMIVAVTLAGCVAPTPERFHVLDDSSLTSGLSHSGLLDASPDDLKQPQANAPTGVRPHSISEDDLSPENYLDMTLVEAVEYALTNTKILRELGGTILKAPDQVETKFSPSAIASDPRYGIEAALSAFDPRFTASGNFEKNNRAFNNIFFGGGTRLFRQDLNVYQTQFS